MTLLTLTIEKIGLKDAGQCIDPYITVSVKGRAQQRLLTAYQICLNIFLTYFFPFHCPDLNGIDLNPVQDTAVATRKEDTYIHFSVDVEIQKHLEKLPKGLTLL